MSDSITYSELRDNLKGALDKVCHDHTSLLVTRQRGEDVIILSRDDYNALDETAYLLKSPKNAKRLRKAVKDVEEGRYSERELIEP